MKIYLTIFFSLILGVVVAQRLPDGGVNRMRIAEADKTILAEVMSGESWTEIVTNKTYYWYSANAIHTTQGGYSGRLLNGLYTEYYLNKNLREQGAFKKGLQDGSWKKWNDKGILQESITWSNGIKSGKFELFNEKGIIKQSGSYQQNLLEGNIKNYINADSAVIVKYQHGKIVPKDKSLWQKVNIFKKTTAKG